MYLFEMKQKCQLEKIEVNKLGTLCLMFSCMCKLKIMYTSILVPLKLTGIERVIFEKASGKRG